MDAEAWLSRNVWRERVYFSRRDGGRAQGIGRTYGLDLAVLVAVVEMGRLPSFHQSVKCKTTTR